VEGDLEGRINAVRGGGQPLPESQRSFFEPRFGHDFSQVRVHTDAEAAEIAEALQARAFTVGHDIVFAAGQHAPETTAGETLLAHELTHVVQQKGANRVSREAAKNDEEEVSPPPGPYTGRRMRNDKMDWYEHNANLFGPPIFERYTRSKALWAPLQGLVEAYWKAGGIQSGIKLDTPQLQQAAWKLLKEVTTPREMGIIKRNVEDYGDCALVEAVFVEFRKHYRPAKRLAHRDWLRSNFRHFHEWAAVTFNFVSPPYAYHAKRAAGT
jgi:hypothetical protein